MVPHNKLEPDRAQWRGCHLKTEVIVKMMQFAESNDLHKHESINELILFSRFIG